MKKGGNIVADAKLTLTLDDKMSIGLTNIRNSINSLTKDVEALNKGLTYLGNNSLEISIDTGVSIVTLEKIKRTFENIVTAAKSGEAELSGIDYSKSIKKLNKLRDEAKETYDELIKLSEASKVSNSIQNKLFPGDMITFFAEQGISAFNAAGSAYFNSALGNSRGNMMSSFVGGMAGGAATGFGIAGLPGAAVGAIVSGLTGIVEAAAENYKNEDALFKDTVKSIADKSIAFIGDTAKTGSEIAESRETVNNRLKNAIGGEENSSLLNNIELMAIRSPFGYNDIANMATSLASNGINEAELLRQLYAIENAGVALNMSAEDLNIVAETIGKINSSDGNILEHIEKLNEYGIDVYSALKIDENKGKKAIISGEIYGEDITQSIRTHLINSFGGQAFAAMDNYSGKKEKLNKWEESFQAASGETYNAILSKEMDNQLSWYNENNHELKQVYSLLGQYQASLDSAESKYEREAFDNLLNGNFTTDEGRNLSREYDEALKNNDELKMAEIVGLTKSIAQANWMDSEEFQSKLDVEGAILNETREKVGHIKEKIDKIYQHMDSYTLGYAATSAYLEQHTEEAVPGEYQPPNAVHKFDESGSVIINGKTSFMIASDPTLSERNSVLRYGEEPFKATGISRVPYDGYRAILHEGERVVTASKAKESERAKGGVNIGNINITASGAINDDETFARMLASQLEKALAAYAV